MKLLLTILTLEDIKMGTNPSLITAFIITLQARFQPMSLFKWSENFKESKIKS